MPAPAHQGTRSDRLRAIWRHRGLAAWALRPLASLYGVLSGLQRALYAWGLRRPQHPGVPVVVIGNVIAGGAGKTPVTLATVAHLQARGRRPGIISRGYGRSTQDVRQATPDAHPQEVGDEPLLMARASGVPVFVARQRIDAARALLAAYPDTDILVCDDGLQHHALARDLEVCVFNSDGVGNGWLLPAGPLREPWPRPVSAVLHAAATPPAGTPADTPCFGLQRQLAPFALTRDGQRVPLAGLQGLRLHALAAIARPEDFFAMLRAQSLELAHTEALPDHYNFESWQRSSDLDLQVICTEKDAVKLWPHVPQALAVPLHLRIAPGYFDLLDARLCLSSTPLNTNR
ncbi:tetraacyldisaccharide 4'-kinase [Comamonas aquatica]|uniref:tetraacyldisaccharide 4'-kinase n=1 Tax=Comamonas aquatica TaxID=225991 RepID=UPI00244A373C|nr:tetraacyldisaccharide 4'-kinase [Comamonas aquatica]MDH0900067.1 tetraacyldisaccharide 4'-kinase [Comamonas aquatica]